MRLETMEMQKKEEKKCKIKNQNCFFTFHFKLSSGSVVKESGSAKMAEGDFWNNLDSFVEQKGSSSPLKGGSEKVDDWLKTIPDLNSESEKNKKKKPPSTQTTPTNAKNSSTIDKLSTPKSPVKILNPTQKKKKQVSIEDGHKKFIYKRSSTAPEKENPRANQVLFNMTRRCKLRQKRRRKSEPLFFGPLVHCNFNLPRVAQQLERLMGSSVVRLTDRKYMLDLQKRIQEDYHDTLMKRISKREATELEREQRMGRSGSEKYPKMIGEHPVFRVNDKCNALLMSKREKLKTVREKNAEELIKQGKRWERERLMRVEQERQREIQSRKEREKQLEEHTLYIFDPDKVDLSAIDLTKTKNRKMTECEIDLKDFLLSERSKKRMTQATLSSEDSMKKSDGKSQDLGSSMDEKFHGEKKLSIAEKEELDMKLQLSADEMRKKQQKKDEDPRITRFKNVESVKEMYALAEELITGDGKKKLLKQIRQLKKSLNITVVKNTQ